MSEQKKGGLKTAIVHYSAPPVIGGVEAVIEAHVHELLAHGYPVRVIAGRGEKAALPDGAELAVIAEMGTQHSQALEAGRLLAQGERPENFEALKQALVERLDPALADRDVVIVHNIFGKHFNLPLTAALLDLRVARPKQRWIAWGHDFTWTSPNSRHKVHPGYPWDLLRGYRSDVIYVVVSQQRQQELAELFGVNPQVIQVIYNGVDPGVILGLSAQGRELARRLGLLQSDLNLLMPVRVTKAKNIELALRVTAVLKQAGAALKVVVTGPPDPHEEKSMAYYRSLLALRKDLDVEDDLRFVFETPLDSGGDLQTDAGTVVAMRVVGELYRLSDALLMPSHREGFGMPVLEAGLMGLAVFSAEAVPAAREIGAPQAVIFPNDTTPEQLALRIKEWMADDPIYQQRRRARTGYTWQALFERQIEPVIQGKGA